MPGAEEYVCLLSEEVMQKAREDLDEDPRRREEDVHSIRQWLKKQPHLNARTGTFHQT